MRTKNSLKNIGASLLGQLVSLVFTFINRRIFVLVLGLEILGVNGLFSNVISILSLAELGIGMAMIYSLYKPMATKDEQKINALLNYYKKIYRWIGIIIFVFGLAIMPFLPYIMKSENEDINVHLIFFVFLLNALVTYFFAYKRSVLIADQKNYIITICHYISFIILNVLQIFILLVFGSYLGYLVVNIVFGIGVNILISHIANKKYPFIKNMNNQSLEIEEKKELTKNIKALALHKVGSVVVNGTDNIVISTYLGLAIVGLYSNYLVIIAALNTFIGQVFGALTASIGNLNVQGSKEQTYKMFNNVLFVNFWIFGFSAITFFILSEDFIRLWLGEDFQLAKPVVITITVYFFLKGTRKTSLIFKDAMGLFWNDRYKPLAEAALNIIFSIYLVQKIGLIGVFLGTILSHFLTCFWIEPYVVYKYGFNKKVFAYYIKYFYYSTNTIIAFLIVNYLVSSINGGLLENLVLKGLVCLIFINFVFFILNIRSAELEYLKSLLKKIIAKRV